MRCLYLAFLMFPAVNMAEVEKKKKRHCVIVLYTGYGGESSRATFKRIPLRYPWSSFNPSLVLPGPVFAHSGMFWSLSPAQLPRGLHGCKHACTHAHTSHTSPFHPVSFRHWSLGVTDSGETCNDALVNNAPALKRYRNVQTKLYLTLIF